MNVWTAIDDTNIRHVWRCADCEDEVNVLPWDYADIGTPYCSDCEKDMLYLSTEMKDG